MLSYNNIDELKTVRFNNGYDCISIQELMDEYMIQEDFMDETEEALRHLIDFSDDVINFPTQVSKAVADTYIAHFNTCLDEVLQDSFDAYENCVILEFEQQILPLVKSSYEQDGVIDVPARQQAFNDYVDGLQKDNRIPTRVSDELGLPDRFES